MSMLQSKEKIDMTLKILRTDMEFVTGKYFLCSQDLLQSKTYSSSGGYIGDLERNILKNCTNVTLQSIRP